CPRRSEKGEKARERSMGLGCASQDAHAWMCSYLRMCLDRCRLTCTIAKETQCARTIENETERPHCTGKGKTSGRGSVTSPSSTAAPGCGFRRPRRKARPLSMDSRLPVLDLLDLQERWQLD
ncbi:hypothetical protein GW17_00061182, partial [Ensete ventricosum]